MKSKKLISLLCAAALSASSFAGLAITSASAAVGDNLHTSTFEDAAVKTTAEYDAPVMGEDGKATTQKVNRVTEWDGNNWGALTGQSAVYYGSAADAREYMSNVIGSQKVDDTTVWTDTFKPTTVTPPAVTGTKSLYFATQIGMNPSGQKVTVAPAIGTSASGVYGVNFDMMLVNGDHEKMFNDTKLDRTYTVTIGGLKLSVTNENLSYYDGNTAIDTGIDLTLAGTWFNFDLVYDVTNKQFKGTITPYDGDNLVEESKVTVPWAKFNGTATTISEVAFANERTDGANKGAVNCAIDNFTVTEAAAVTYEDVTINFKSGDTTLKTETVKAETGTTLTASDSYKVDFATEASREAGKYYVYDNTSTDSVTVAEGAAINLNFTETAMPTTTIKAVTGDSKTEIGTIVSAKVVPGETVTDYANEYMQGSDDKWYQKNDGNKNNRGDVYNVSATGGKEDTTVTVDYKPAFDVVSYKEAEDDEDVTDGTYSANYPKENASGGKWVQSATASNYCTGFLTAPVEKAGTYSITVRMYNNTDRPAYVATLESGKETKYANKIGKISGAGLLVNTFTAELAAGDCFYVGKTSELAESSSEAKIIGDVDYIVVKDVNVDAEPVANVTLTYAKDGKTVSLTHDQDRTVPVTLIHASYDNGVLSDMETFSLDVTSGTTATTQALAKTVKAGDKLMVWDSLNGMKPLAESHTITAEEADVIETQKTALTGVTISGTAQVTAKLTATVAPEGATATYSWEAKAADSDNWVPINGATANTYKVAENDLGKTIRVVATGTGDYEGTVTSVATEAVIAAPEPQNETVWLQGKYMKNYTTANRLVIDGRDSATAAAALQFVLPAEFAAEGKVVKSAKLVINTATTKYTGKAFVYKFDTANIAEAATGDTGNYTGKVLTYAAPVADDKIGESTANVAAETATEIDITDYIASLDKSTKAVAVRVDAATGTGSDWLIYDGTGDNETDKAPKLEIVMGDPTYTVSGTVDAGIKSVKLTGTATNGVYAGDLTKETGKVIFSDVPSDTYTVDVEYNEGYEAPTTPVTSVTVDGADKTDLEFTSKAIVRTVTITADANITDVKLQKGTETAIEKTSAENNVYTFADVAYGEYAIVVTYANGYEKADDSETTVTVATEAVSKTIASKKSTYNVTVAEGISNGNITFKVNDEDAATAQIGDTVTVTATPADDTYELATLTYTVGTGEAQNITDLTFTMPAGNVTISATFVKKTKTITITQVSNATITINEKNDSTSAKVDDTVTVTAVPGDGYSVTAVTVSPAELDQIVVVTPGANNTYTFTMPNDDVTVTATVAQNKDTTPATIEVTPASVSALQGETKSFSATVKDGDGEVTSQNGVTWSVSDNKTSTNTTISAEGVLTIGSDETATTLTVTATSTVATSVSGTATVTVANGYVQKTLTVVRPDGETAIEGATVAATDKSALTNGFAPTLFAIVDTAVTTGTTDASGNVTLALDPNKTYTVTVTKGGATLYTGDLTEATTIKVPAASTTVPEADTNGNVVALTPANAIAGDTVTITPTAGTDYVFTGVTVKAKDSGETVVETKKQENGTYTFTMPAEGVTVTPVFAKLYAVEADKAENGTVEIKNEAGTDALASKVVAGTKFTIVATPDTNYEVGTVTVSYNDVEDKTLTPEGDVFTMPEYDVTVTVTFVYAPKSAVNVSTVVGGTVTPSATTDVKAGTEVTVEATAYEDYTLTALSYKTATGEPQDILEAKKFTMPTEDVTISATFTLAANIYLASESAYLVQNDSKKADAAVMRINGYNGQAAYPLMRFDLSDLDFDHIYSANLKLYATSCGNWSRSGSAYTGLVKNATWSSESTWTTTNSAVVLEEASQTTTTGVTKDIFNGGANNTWSEIDITNTILASDKGENTIGMKTSSNYATDINLAGAGDAAHAPRLVITLGKIITFNAAQAATDDKDVELTVKGANSFEKTVTLTKGVGSVILLPGDYTYEMTATSDYAEITAQSFNVSVDDTVNVTLEANTSSPATLKVVYTTSGDDSGKVGEEVVYGEDDAKFEGDTIEASVFDTYINKAVTKLNDDNVRTDVYKYSSGAPTESFDLAAGENVKYLTVALDDTYYVYDDFTSLKTGDSIDSTGFTVGTTGSVVASDGYLTVNNVGKTSGDANTYGGYYSDIKTFNESVQALKNVTLSIKFQSRCQGTKNRKAGIDIVDSSDNAISGVVMQAKQGNSDTVPAGYTYKMNSLASAILGTGTNVYAGGWADGSFGEIYTLELTLDFNNGKASGKFISSTGVETTIPETAITATNLGKIAVTNIYSTSPVAIYNISVK
ncbi:MAG: hypothetical protein ACI4A5_11880 [Hominilimicola sp.]